jgi:hypothetical protein
VLTSPAPADGLITTAPASRTPVWRATVIGLVALLAVAIGVALGAYLLGGRGTGTGMGTAASYVPADAPFYVEVRLEPSDEQDAALRHVLGWFPIDGIDLARPLDEELTERLDELLASGGAELTWARDVAPWFDGRLAFAMTDGTMLTSSADPMTGIPEIPALVMLGVADRAAASDAIERILAEAGSGMTFTDSAHAGFTIRESTQGFGAFALADGQLLIAMDGDTIRDALDTHASGATLAGSQGMSDLTSELPSDWLVLATYEMSGLMADVLAQMGTQSPEMTEAFESLLEGQPMRAAMSISASEDGIVMDVVSDAPTGPMAVENADRGLADEVPGDAMLFSEAGHLGPSYAATIGALKEGLAGDPAAAEQIRLAEAALGADLEELVSWIGDGAFVAGWDGTQWYGGMILVPTDMEAAERRLGQLASFAELAALDPSSGVSVTTAEHESGTVTTIRWQPPADALAGAAFLAPDGVLVEFVVTDTRVIVGIGDAFVGRVLAVDATGSLAVNPGYIDAVAALGGSTNAATTWIDLIRAREALEGTLATTEAHEGYVANVRSWLIPLQRLVSVARLEGDLVLTRAILFVDAGAP